MVPKAGEGCTAADQQRVSARFNDFCKRGFELTFAARLHNRDLPPKRTAGYLDVRHFADRARIVWIQHHGHDGSLGKQIMQQLHPLRTEHAAAEERHTREVAARPAETADEAAPHRIVAGHEHDRDGRRRRPGRHSREVVADDHSRLPADQVSGERGQPVQMIVRVALLDCDVLALDKALLFQTLAECRQNMRERGGRRAAEEPDCWQCRLLRARHERPERGYRRAADERDELASFQSIELHLIPRQPGPDGSISNLQGSASG